eukprot:CAMPEP_0195065804 /NCGR_PEP_ID=MMETSP0448-20130528/11351_1 /TAXON_ID=66468 /ORGANISM="Heterocapsa triquestra, Strain CCMP 448" /LENGTH=46 /DNA_ID= /DNA_START= /DNA_END= /DNA_ORIENTATION=
MARTGSHSMSSPVPRQGLGASLRRTQAQGSLKGGMLSHERTRQGRK